MQKVGNLRYKKIAIFLQYTIRVAPSIIERTTFITLRYDSNNFIMQSRFIATCALLGVPFFTKIPLRAHKVPRLSSQSKRDIFLFHIRPYVTCAIILKYCLWLFFKNS